MQLTNILLPFLASSTLVAGAVIAKPVEDAVDPVSHLLGLLGIVIQDVDNNIGLSKRSEELAESDPIGGIVTGFTKVLEATKETTFALQTLKTVALVVEKPVCNVEARFVAFSRHLGATVITQLVKAGDRINPVKLIPGLKTVADVVREEKAAFQELIRVTDIHAPSCAAVNSAAVDALNEDFEKVICAFTPGSTMVGPLCKVAALAKRVENAADPVVNTLQQLTITIQVVIYDLEHIKRGLESVASGPVQGVITGFTAVVGAGEKTVLALAAAKPIAKVVDQQRVCKSLKELVTVTQNLFHAVVEKSSATTFLPVAKTVAQLLKEEKAAADKIAADIYGLVPGCATVNSESVKALDAEFEKAICAVSPGATMVGSLCKIAESV